MDKPLSRKKRREIIELHRRGIGHPDHIPLLVAEIERLEEVLVAERERLEEEISDSNGFVLEAITHLNFYSYLSVDKDLELLRKIEDQERLIQHIREAVKRFHGAFRNVRSFNQADQGSYLVNVIPALNNLRELVGLVRTCY